MLRILVISLVVANLLLLAFQDSKPVVAPETAVAQTMVIDTGIPTIHLFSEMLQDEGLLSGNRQCFSLGPFHSSEEMDETHLLLQAVSTRISERRTEALVEKGYWVFMPPYASVLEANQELISLQALGLEDIGIIHEGEWENAISLGYFMRQENAVRRKKSLEDKGYAPLMRVQRQSEPRYWLDYEQTPGSGLIALDMQDRPNDFMQRSLPCPEEHLFESVDTESQDPIEDLAEIQTPEEEGIAPGQVETPGVEEALESTAEDIGDAMPKQAEDIEEAIPDQAIESEAESAGETSTGEG
jgi:hypothetical protein